MDILSIQNMFQNLGNMDLTVNQAANNDSKMDFSSLYMGITTTQQTVQTASTTNANSENLVRIDDSGKNKLNFKESNVKDDVASKEMSDDQTKEIVEFKDDVVKKVSEICDVDEETVEQTMEELALTMIDLFDPQNLAKLVATLSETDDITSLLMSEDFSNLMGDLNTLLSDLSESLGMNSDEMKELLAQFDFTDSQEFAFAPEMISEEMIEGIAAETEGEVLISDEAYATTERVETPETQMAQSETTVEVTQDVVSAVKDESDGLKVKLASKESTTENVSPDKAPTDEDIIVVDKRSNTSDSKHESGNLFAQNGQETEVDTASQVAASDTTFTDSYTSVDPISLLEQITQNLKVTLQNDATTMEMQLNPENLGKVFLQVSSKQGVVSAQIAASNETVKEILETQMADLRQNLSQQGVKVDAIEVTVSSHGFERNLDDSEKRQEQEAMMQEEKKSGRRSLRLDSLDELSGLMSEEEMLVAQIMRDNGNSMDLTA